MPKKPSAFSWGSAQNCFVISLTFRESSLRGNRGGGDDGGESSHSGGSCCFVVVAVVILAGLRHVRSRGVPGDTARGEPGLHSRPAAGASSRSCCYLGPGTSVASSVSQQSPLGVNIRTCFTILPRYIG